MVETGRFYIKPFMSICNKENSSHPAQVLFFAGTSLSLLLDTVDKSGSVFFLYRFFKQRISQMQKTNFFTAHSVTQMSEVIILLYSVTILSCKAS